jgi:hypothetical protein
VPDTLPDPFTVLPALPALSAQAERLIELGVHETAGLSADEIRSFAAAADGDGALLAVHPDRAPASALAPLLRRAGKPGFVVADMPDVDAFTPCDAVLPDVPLYVVTGVDRGDGLANRSPDEALPALTAQGRTPLVLTEGIHWLLQRPEVLERNRCFMTIGSRLRKGRRRTGRPHPGDLDQQRHRAGRPRAPRRPEGRLVLVEQPPHLARLRLRHRPQALATSSPARGGPGRSGSEPGLVPGRRLHTSHALKRPPSRGVRLITTSERGRPGRAARSCAVAAGPPVVCAGALVGNLVRRVGPWREERM